MPHLNNISTEMAIFPERILVFHHPWENKIWGPIQTMGESLFGAKSCKKKKKMEIERKRRGKAKEIQVDVFVISST